MEIITGPLAVFIAGSVAATVVTALVILAVSRFRKARIGMDITEFFTRLIRGRGFENLDPESFQQKLEQPEWDGLVVDLREPMNFREGHIPGATHRPFDDFLKEVVAEGRFDEYRERDVVLLCDSGHMSRVAGEVLGLDLGFSKVFNLRGGMKQWWKWKASQTSVESQECCLGWSLPRCCTRAA
jgi:thiosulfate sulfurtransferase